MTKISSVVIKKVARH